MAEAPSSTNGFRWPLVLFGAGALVAIVLAMLGQRPPVPWTYQPGGQHIPMAPQTAVSASLLALSLVLLGAAGTNRTLHRLAALCVAPAILMNLASILGMAVGAPSPLGAWILRYLITFTRMSPLTVAALAGAWLALLPSLSSAAPSWARRQPGALAALVPLGLGTAVLLSYLAGAPLLYGSAFLPMSNGAALVSILLGLGLLKANGDDTWPQALFVHLDADQEPPQGPPSLARLLSRFWRSPLPLFGVLSLVILAGGSLFQKWQLAQARSRAESELALIADQKVEQVLRWHQNQETVSRQLFQGNLLQGQFRSFLAETPDAPPLSQLRGMLEDLKPLGFSDAMLFDADGACRLATTGARPPAPDAPALRAALRATDVLETDLHAEGPDDRIYLSFWVPIGPVTRGRAQGALLLQVDAATFLFPTLRSWPTLSRSAETVLLRREGDRVVCLNPLRSGAERPLQSSRSLTENPRMTATVAINQGSGFTLGPDYRGVPVLAALRQVPGTPWWMVAKEDQEEVFAKLRMRNGVTMSALLALVLVLALVIGVRLRNHDNREILAQLQREREHKSLAERFRQIMLQANDIILLLDCNGRMVEANLRAEEAYGYSLAELERMNIRELRAPQALASLDANFQQAWTGELKRLETWHLRRDGSQFPVEVSTRSVVFAGETFILSFVRDITERHRQNLALERLSRLYAALSQVNQAIVWSVGQEALFEKICQVLVEFGGFQMAWIGRHERDAQTVTMLCHYGMAADYFQNLQVRTDDSPLAQGPVGTVFRENRPCLFSDFQEAERTRPWHALARECGFASVAAFPVRLDGRPLYSLAVYAKEPDFFGEGEMALLEEAALDLSFALAHLAQEERRTLAEEALRQSEAHLTALTACAPDLILTVDARGRILYTNRPLRGQDEAPVGEHNWTEWLTPEAGDRARAALSEALATGQSQELETPGSLSHPEPRWYRIRISSILGARAGAAAVVFATDIDHARKAQAEQADLAAQLAQSQKLESLGSLAGGVAHDMNNVLGAILSLASAHREQRSEDDPLAASLDTIISACMRGRGVVKSLLYFAHKDLEQVTAIDLNNLVTDMVQLLAYTTLKRIRLHMALQEGLGTLHGDSGALSHTLMNLCVNAMDAMPSGGALTLRTVWLPDGRLQLSVEDTGCGMTPEVREKALEPFFTTKPQGKGTGLGLAMAYATMQAHDGSLELFSEPDQGTRVVLTFPAARVSGAPSETPAARPEPTLATGPWRLLLVDDDDLIRDSVAPMLGFLGHQVHTAPGGREALTLLEQGLDVDLVILDMNMPGLNGAATLPLLLDLRPGQRVLMATGYSDEDLAGLLDGRENLYSIHKPFSLNEIKAKFAAIFGSLAARPSGG